MENVECDSGKYASFSPGMIYLLFQMSFDELRSWFVPPDGQASYSWLRLIFQCWYPFQWRMHVFWPNNCPFLVCCKKFQWEQKISVKSKSSFDEKCQIPEFKSLLQTDILNEK